MSGRVNYGLGQKQKERDYHGGSFLVKCRTCKKEYFGDRKGVRCRSCTEAAR